MDNNVESSSPENIKKSSTISIVVTLVAAILIVSVLVWFFGINLILEGIGGFLLIVVIASGIGAVVVGVVLFIMGKPIVLILPLLWLGLKTSAIIIGIVLLLLFLYSILSPSDNGNKESETD